MENQRWPLKQQQSAPLNMERTDDNLNNGNCEFTLDSTDSNENAGKDDPESPIKVEDEHFLAQRMNRCNISKTSKQVIHNIVEQVKSLSYMERFLLYLKLPSGTNSGMDPLRQPLNPLGNRSEIYRTIAWIQTHLQEDPQTSLPKKEVYNEYNDYCAEIKIKPLSQADFGKVMKQVYPKIRARRLGIRGHSKYCYAGLTRCGKLKAPFLPEMADNPTSIEAANLQSTLTTAAWFIVKQWSEKILKKEFDNLEALAFYLVIEQSVGAGTMAATQIKSQKHVKDEDSSSGRFFNKHRETQLQLQKKLRENEVNKKRKRKLQTLKCDSKISGKKPKPHTAPCSRQTSTERSPPFSTGTSSCSTSPTQGKSICDKSLDFSQISALPDFASFQRPAGEHSTGKVAIPRLGGPPSRQSAALSTVKSAKYKAIQPKLCDNASYNPQLAAADIPRSQTVHNINKFGRSRKGSEDDGDVVAELPLPRERLESISNVAKDAMDEYLGTNNSQHDEELSKYFGNEPVVDSTDTNVKLSQLRQILEQNGIVADGSKTMQSNLLQDNPGTLIPSDVILESPIIGGQSVPTNSTSYITSHVLNNSLHSLARRRVSFENPIPEDAVPPSPNTRRKNFSFTPISPGPHSPNGRQSKSSSRNASPFVSPRSTPVPRVKNTTHQNAGIMLQIPRQQSAVKKEPDLVLNIKEENSSNFALTSASAPTSPRMASRSMLQKLLNSRNKVSYSSDYVNAVDVQTVRSNNELTTLFVNEQAQVSNDLTFRSQSVPLHQMKNSYPVEEPFVLNDPNQDFTDIDPLANSNTEVNQIISTLEDHSCGNTQNSNIGIYNVGMSTGDMNQFGLVMENNMEISSANYAANTLTPFENPVSRPITASRGLVRSQSIDVSENFENKCVFSRRSVPSTPTPLPFLSAVNIKAEKNFQNQISRSHPSTPLLSQEAFNYNLNRDCLLNGQPIRNEGLQNSLGGMINRNEWNGDNIEQGKGFDMEGRPLPEDDFGLVENENALMDDNGILITDQNFSNINN